MKRRKESGGDAKERLRTGLLWTVAIASIGLGLGGSLIQPPPESEQRRELAEVQRLAATDALAEGDAATATRATLEALALDADKAASWELLGDLRFRQERFDDARAAYHRATELDGHRFRPWLQLGRTHRALARTEDAQAAIRRAREIDPDHPDAAAEAASLAEERGELRQAIDLYETAVRRARGTRRANLLTKLAAVQERDGDAEAAAEALVAAARADDTNASRWTRAASALQRAGDRDEARKAMDRAAVLTTWPAS